MTNDIQTLISQCRELADRADKIATGLVRQKSQATAHSGGCRMNSLEQIAAAARDFHTISKTAFDATCRPALGGYGGFGHTTPN